MTRRRPEFEPGVAGAFALNLNKLSDGGGSQIQWLTTQSETDFAITIGIKAYEPQRSPPQRRGEALALPI